MRRPDALEDEEYTAAVSGRGDMGRLLWPLALVVTFVIGGAAGGLARKGPSAAPDVDQQKTVSRLEQQVTTLQARLRARESPAQAGAPAGTSAGRSEEHTSE